MTLLADTAEPPWDVAPTCTPRIGDADADPPGTAPPACMGVAGALQSCGNGGAGAGAAKLPPPIGDGETAVMKPTPRGH